ncbi:hypothetical protein SPH9361_02291 [Sphingobium sp. CECT 9361]|nr:hypothetical protein SPH9361_02291 [Sphingobium sp. CECT 9361]
MAALSRRPGFSKNILVAGLREAGIAYVGLKALGTPAEGREAAIVDTRGCPKRLCAKRQHAHMGGEFLAFSSTNR